MHVGQSQSDPEQVEIRIFEAPGIQLTGALQREIEKYFSRRELRRVAFSEVAETTYPARVRESYAQDILDGIDVGAIRARGFRLAVDYGHSAGSFTLPLVLGPLAVEAVAVHGFFTAETGPVASPDDAKRLVTAVAADFGAVLDGAAERLRLIDERGEEVPAESALLLFVRLLAESGREGSIAVPVTATDQVDALLDGSSLNVMRTPHSLSDLTRVSAQPGVVFAGATSGGFVFPDVVPGYDAVTALCKLLELLSTVSRPLSELVAGLPQPTLLRRTVDCPWGKKGLVMRVLNERLAGRRLDLLDGVKAYDDRGWVQAVPDPDEPFVHVFAEGETVAGSEELGAELAAQIEAIVQGDGAPQRTGAAATSS